MTTKKRWSETEKQQLQQFYPNIGTKRLRELFSDRSAMSIYKAASQMGVGKSHDRLIEQGRENVGKRKDRQATPTEGRLGQPFKEPPSIQS